jgi:NADH dehydrogenase
MKQVLVLGGSGFVGGHVCEKLVRAGYRVSVTTRKAVHARSVMHLPGLTVLECNIHDEAALKRAMVGMDAVINLVAILHGSPAAFVQVHQDLPAKIARACVAKGVRHLVHISALGVNAAQPQAAPSNYLRSKAVGETLLADTLGWGQGGMGICGLTVLRPSVIFGEDDAFINLFAGLQNIAPFVPLAGAASRFQPVWVQDVAQALVYALQHRDTLGQIYELAGPQIFTLKQLVQHAGRWSRHARPVFGLPEAMAYLQALVMEMLPGPPLMSRDNLASMQVDNVTGGKLPGLQQLGVAAAARLDSVFPLSDAK